MPAPLPAPIGPAEVAQHHAWVRRLAASLARGDDPDDLAQEAWLAMLRAPPPEGVAARAWLAGIARRLAYVRQRGERRRTRRDSDLAAEREIVTPGADVALEQLHTLRQITQLVHELDEPFRSTVRLRYEDDLSAAEIARRQGVPPGTVRWRLKVGLDRMREAFDRQEGGSEARRALLALLLVGPRGTSERGAGAGRGVWQRFAWAAVPIALVAGVAAQLTLRGDEEPPSEHALAPAGPRDVSANAATAPGFLRGQEPGRTPSALPGVIRGQVFDWSSGKTIGGARLAFDREGDSFEASTDAAGGFALSVAKAGHHSLVSARAEGYFPFVRKGHDNTIVAHTRPGRGVEGLAIYLRPALAYRGLVLGPGGEPVAGARVRLLDDSGERWPAGTAPDSFVTDGGGEFSFQAPEVSTLDVTHPGYGSAWAKLDASTYFERQVTIRLAEAAPRLKALAGRVVDEAGKPLAGAVVHAEPEEYDDSTVTAQTTSDATGRFAFALPPGTRRVLVSSEGGVAHSFPGRRPGAGETTLVLRRGATVHGRALRGAGGEPATSFGLMLEEEVGGSFQPLDVRSVNDPEGEFTLEGVRPGVYGLSVFAPGFVESSRQRVEITGPGALVPPVELALSEGVGLRGRVVAAEDGRPVAGARVRVLTPPTPGLDVLPISPANVTDNDGFFTLRGLKAGRTLLSFRAAGRDTRIVPGPRLEGGAELGPTLVALPLPGPGERPGTWAGGLGATYRPIADAMVVVRVRPGGGAAEAGLVPGDAIVALDGVPFGELGADEFLDRSRTPEAGAPARVLVRHEGAAEAVEVVVPRRLFRF